jgi:hypothetical protein
MNTTELDPLIQKVPRRIASVEITDGPGPLPHGVFEQAPRVIATLDGRREEAPQDQETGDCADGSQERS